MSAQVAKLPYLKSQRFYLSIGPNKTGLQIARTIGDFNIPLRIFDGSKGTYTSRFDKPTMEPVLRVESEKATGGFDSRELIGGDEIKNFLRRYALKKNTLYEDSFDSDYSPHGIDFPYYPDGRGIVCFGRDGKETYRGLLKNYALPIQTHLDFSTYCKTGAWHIALWEICVIDELNEPFRHAAVCGMPFISKTPPAVLTNDEVRKLANGKTTLIITEDGAVMANAWFEAYFVHHNVLYRLWAHNPD